MNDHPAHAGDIVRDKGQPTAIPLTVHHIEPGPDPLLLCTQSTGGRFIERRASTVDVLTPAGCAA